MLLFPDRMNLCMDTRLTEVRLLQNLSHWIFTNTMYNPENYIKVTY